MEKVNQIEKVACHSDWRECSFFKDALAGNKATTSTALPDCSKHCKGRSFNSAHGFILRIHPLCTVSASSLLQCLLQSDRAVDVVFLFPASASLKKEHSLQSERQTTIFSTVQPAKDLCF